MSADSGRPRPFLTGVFKTACNYCVSSKRGCSGGQPCEQCEKRGKTCVYAQRRKSGPRSRAAAAAAATADQPASGGGDFRASSRHDVVVAAAAFAAAGSSAAALPPQQYTGDEHPGGESWAAAAHSDLVVEHQQSSAPEWGSRRADYYRERQQQQQQQQQQQPPSLPRRPVTGSALSPLLVESPSMWGREDAAGKLEIPLPPPPALVLPPASRATIGSARAQRGDLGGGGQDRRETGSLAHLRASSDGSAASSKRARFALTPPPPSSAAAGLALDASSSPHQRPRGGASNLFCSRSTSLDGAPSPLSSSPFWTTPPPSTAVAAVPRDSGAGVAAAAAAAGHSGASSWAAVAAMAASCAGDGGGGGGGDVVMDELEDSFGLLFPAGGGRDRQQEDLKDQQRMLEQKELRLHRWQQQLEQQQQRQQHQRQHQHQHQHLHQDQDGCHPSKRQLSLGSLLMAAEDSDLGASSRHNVAARRTKGRSVAAANIARSSPSSPAYVAPGTGAVPRAISGETSTHGDDGHRCAASAAASSVAAGEGLRPLASLVPRPLPLPLPHRRMPDLATLSMTASAAAAEESSAGRLVVGQPLPAFLPHAGGGGDGGDDEQEAHPLRLDCAAAAVAGMRTPLTREGSLLLAIEAVTAAFGGGDDAIRQDPGGGGGGGDMRTPLSREESLLRAVEVVTSRSVDGGGGADDEDFEKAAAELIASVGLVHVDGGDLDEVFSGVFAAAENGNGVGGDVAVPAR